MTTPPTADGPVAQPRGPGAGPVHPAVPTEDVTPSERPPTSMRRAMAFMTTTSVLVPVIGVATAPVLARALGVEGRGEVAAATAPAALVVAVATLGLPEALTYHLARRPEATRRALASSSAVSLLLGAVCWTLCWAFADALTGGDSSLAGLMLVGTALAIPSMLVGLLRGAAAGLQMWGTVAADRVLSSVLRLVVLLGLALAGLLDVRVAVIALSLVPVVAGLVYWRVLRRRPALPPDDPLVRGGAPQRPVSVDLFVFGSRTWLGSVASMATGRVAQLLTAPLAGTTQLGLLVVAITISDVLFIVVIAVRDALYGVSARLDDRDQLMAVSRSTTLVGAVGALAVGVTVPLWIVPLFGEQFTAATVPTWWLLLAAVTNVPGLMASAGLGAWGRPALRSASFVVALLVLLVGFVLLVPGLGAVGAGIAAVASGSAMSLFAVLAAARFAGAPASAFVVPRRSDLAVLRAEAVRGLSALRALPRARWSGR